MDVNCIAAIAIAMIGSITTLLVVTKLGSSNPNLNNFLAITKSYKASSSKSENFIVFFFGMLLMMSVTKKGLAAIIVVTAFGVAGNVCNSDLFAQLTELFKVFFHEIRETP